MTLPMPRTHAPSEAQVILVESWFAELEHAQIGSEPLILASDG